VWNGLIWPVKGCSKRFNEVLESAREVEFLDNLRIINSSRTVCHGVKIIIITIKQAGSP
jgi:hypothetical protein